MMHLFETVMEKFNEVASRPTAGRLGDVSLLDSQSPRIGSEAL